MYVPKGSNSRCYLGVTKRKYWDNLTLDCSGQKRRGRKGNYRKINNICQIFKEINLLDIKLICHMVCSVPASSNSQTDFYGWYSSWQFSFFVLLCKALLTVLTAIKPLAKLLFFPSCGKLFLLYNNCKNAWALN